MMKGATRRIGIATTIILAVLCLQSGRASAALTDTLLAAWQFNGNLTDATNNGYNLTFAGTAAATYTGGPHVALALDGVDQHASVAVSFPGSTLNFAASSFTIAAWATIHLSPTARREAMLVGRPSNTSFNDYAMTVDYNMQTDTSGQPTVTSYTGPGGGTGGPASGVAYDTYVSLVATYDQPTHTITLYRNGSLRDSRTTSVTGPISNASVLEFGDAFGVFLKADLDEIQIYGRSFTSSEVASTFTATGPAAIPEPAGFAAAAIASTLLVNRRRHSR